MTDIKLENNDEYADKDRCKKEYVIKKTARASMYLHSLYRSQFTKDNRFKMYERLDAEIIKFDAKFNALNSIFHRLKSQEKHYFFNRQFTTFESGRDYHIYVLISESCDRMLYDIADIMKTHDDDVLRMCVFHSLDKSIMDEGELEWYKFIEDRWGTIEKEFKIVNDTVKFLYRQKYGKDFDDGVVHFTDADTERLKDDFLGP